MLIKKLIIFLFFVVSTGIIIFFIFWDIPAPNKQIERKIDINRLKKND